MTEYNIRLNPNCAAAVHTGLKFKAGDKGIAFKIAVDELDTTDTTAKIVFLRANGTSVESNITGTGGVYTYKTLGNEFAVPGKTVADVKFYAADARVSTASFVFEVSGDTMDGLGAGAGGYSDRLEQLATEAEDAMKNAENVSKELENLLIVYQNKFGEVGVLNPKGTYNNATTYEAFDLVYYGGVSWLCLQRCTGVTPAEGAYWQLFASADGGNASKLGGKSASEWQSDITQLNGTGEWLGTSILEKALEVGVGVHSYTLGGGQYTGGDLPNGLWAYGMATIYKRGVNSLSVVLHYEGTNRSIINSYNGVWSGWGEGAITADLANYLPLNGTGVLKKLTETDLGGRIALEKPNTGNDFQANIAIDLYKNMLRFVETGGTVRGAFIDLAKCPPECKAELLHTGNKPSGSYTGNGSETERTIAIGGNGNGVLIFGSNGTTALVAEGAICGNGSSVSGVQHGQARLTTTKDITMKLVTNHPALNESGVIYYFAVL